MSDKGTKILEIRWGDQHYLDMFAHDIGAALKKATEHFKRGAKK